MGEAVQVATEADIVSRNVALTSEEKGGTNSDPSQVLVKPADICVSDLVLLTHILRKRRTSSHSKSDRPVDDR